MKKKIIFGLVLVSLIVIPVLVACAAPTPTVTPTTPATTAPAPTTPDFNVRKFRVGSPFPPPPAATTAGPAYFQDLVTKGSGGKITFENNWGGALFAPGESVEAVQNGLVDIAFTSAVYAPGKLVLRNMQQSFPWGIPDMYKALEVWHKLFNAIPAFEAELAKYGIKEFYGQGGLPYDIQSKAPVTKLDDLKGVKFGCAGAVAPKWVEDGGATPVSLSMTERYTALERGTISAQFTSYDWVIDGKFYEVAKHYSVTGVCGFVMPWGGGWMNLDVWNSLTDAEKKLFMDAASEAEIYHIDNTYSRRDGDFQTMKEKGMTIHTFDQAEKAKWAERMPDYGTLWADEAEKQGLPGWDVLKTYVKLSEEAGHVWPQRPGE